MDIISGGRGTGKTKKLLEISEKEQIPIICSSRDRAHALFKRAKTEGYDIPCPISCDNLNIMRGTYIKRDVLVDDAEQVLAALMSPWIPKIIVVCEEDIVNV